MQAFWCSASCSQAFLTGWGGGSKILLVRPGSALGAPQSRMNPNKRWEGPVLCSTYCGPRHLAQWKLFFGAVFIHTDWFPVLVDWFTWYARMIKSMWGMYSICIWLPDCDPSRIHRADGHNEIFLSLFSGVWQAQYSSENVVCSKQPHTNKTISNPGYFL